VLRLRAWFLDRAPTLSPMRHSKTAFVPSHPAERRRARASDGSSSSTVVWSFSLLPPLPRSPKPSANRLTATPRPRLFPVQHPMHPGKIDRRPAGPLEPHGDRSEPVGPDGSADSILLHGTERHRGQGRQYPCRHRHWAIDFATGKVATPITWVDGTGKFADASGQIPGNG
jgi:hypothetical protein